MNQHPLPQNITAYQFRLIGDMTIKQFIFLSAGVGGAIFFYYTNLFSLIKWMLVSLSALSGFAIAFLPLEERPLDQWIINYIKAIYRPVRFVWQKQPEIPPYFSFTPNTALLPADAQELAKAAAIRKQQGLHSFLITLPQDQTTNLDQQVQGKIDSFLDMFSGNAAVAPVTPNSVGIINAPLPIIDDVKEEDAPAVSNQPKPKPASLVQPPPQSVAVSRPDPIPTTSLGPTIVSQAQPNSSTLTAKEITGTTVSAATNQNLPFPSVPTSPNTVVGMILTPEGKIVDNAIVEVLDESGLPVRATKTNQLGQFFSTTPLKRGTYRITVEKPGLLFDTIELQLTGQIVEPLKIQAKT